MKLVPLALAVAISLVSTAASGFHEIDSFARSANSGGGAGSYYTGSKRFKGYDCNICHLEAEHRISIELGGDLSGGRYSPGLIYRIDLRLVGEHRGLDSAFNPNTFTLDITDLDGRPLGTLSGADSVVEGVDDERVAIAEGFGNGEDEWSVSWFAPDEAVQARLHVAMLDGDGASDPVVRFIDPLNDDVATLVVDLCPEGADCRLPEAPEEETSPAGCRAAGTGAGAGCLPLLVALVLCGRRRRR